MKGAIEPNHIPVNNYELLIIGLPSFTAVEISGLEDELQTVELPDRTVASGGNRGPSEFTMMLPMHHTAEQLAAEAWYQEAQDPVLPTYKKIGTLVLKAITGEVARVYALTGAFIKKRTTPDLELNNDGEQANVEWTVSVDDIKLVR